MPDNLDGLTAIPGFQNLNVLIQGFEGVMETFTKQGVVIRDQNFHVSIFASEFIIYSILYLNYRQSNKRD